MRDEPVESNHDKSSLLLLAVAVNPRGALGTTVIPSPDSMKAFSSLRGPHILSPPLS